MRGVAHAAGATCVIVRHLRFEDIAYEDEFDGVWACASLLHVPKSRIDGVLRRLSRALKVGGILYMSFKKGDGESVRDGRLFNNYPERSLRDLLMQLPELEKLRIWQTTDRRPDREGETWINAIARKALGSMTS
jgi:SAM-dependent methyltransferase